MKMCEVPYTFPSTPTHTPTLRILSRFLPPSPPPEHCATQLIIFISIFNLLLPICCYYIALMMITMKESWIVVSHFEKVYIFYN